MSREQGIPSQDIQENGVIRMRDEIVLMAIAFAFGFCLGIFVFNHSGDNDFDPVYESKQIELGAEQEKAEDEKKAAEETEKHTKKEHEKVIARNIPAIKKLKTEIRTIRIKREQAALDPPALVESLEIESCKLREVIERQDKIIFVQDKRIRSLENLLRVTRDSEDIAKKRFKAASNKLKRISKKRFHYGIGVMTGFVSDRAGGGWTFGHGVGLQLTVAI